MSGVDRVDQTNHNTCSTHREGERERERPQKRNDAKHKSNNKKAHPQRVDQTERFRDRGLALCLLGSGVVAGPLFGLLEQSIELRVDEQRQIAIPRGADHGDGGAWVCVAGLEVLDIVRVLRLGLLPRGRDGGALVRVVLGHSVLQQEWLFHLFARGLLFQVLPCQPHEVLHMLGILRQDILGVVAVLDPHIQFCWDAAVALANHADLAALALATAVPRDLLLCAIDVAGKPSSIHIP